MGCHITKGVSERCILRLLLTNVNDIITIWDQRMLGSPALLIFLAWRFHAFFINSLYDLYLANISLCDIHPLFTKLCPYSFNMPISLTILSSSLPTPFISIPVNAVYSYLSFVLKYRCSSPVLGFYSSRLMSPGVLGMFLF